MKTAVLIGIAAFTAACGGSNQTHTDASAKAGAAASPPATNAPAAAASQSASSTVTLVGCLQGPQSSGVTGTAGTAASDRASAGADAAATPTHGAAPIGPFVLANAAVESDAAGANGAGGSGASAGSSYELDGVPADARASVNKLVRVTGRIVARNALSPDATASAASPSTTGETSSRDDVRANSTGVAGDSTNHRLTVETVQVVAQQCGPR